MPNIFEQYKPLRNFATNFELFESLEVCWNISNYLHLSRPIPTNLELDNKLKHNLNPILFRVNVINDWELEFLASEIILTAPTRVIDNKKSLYLMRDRNKCVSHIRRIRDTIESSIQTDKDIFLELNRIAHQQFLWQARYSAAHTYRYYFIFNSTGLDQIVQATFNLSISEIFKSGISLLFYFQNNFSLQNNITSNIGTATPDDINNFVNVFSSELNEIRNLITQTRVYNENLIYQFNPIRTFPIIKSTSYFCPIPLLLFWRFTSGIYYDICNKPDFDNAFGLAFQKYLIEVVNKCNTNNKIQLHPEMQYGNPEKSTADLMLEDENSILFIECKTKRMVWKAKELIDDTLDLEVDLDTISNAFYQVYKTIEDYKNNLYPNMPFNESKKIFVMVVTLENWYIGYNDFIYNKLRENILFRFISDNKKAKDLLEYPYFFFSSEEFENALQVISEIGITEYFRKFKEEHGFDAFKDFNYSNLFLEEVKSIFFAPKN